MRVSDEEPDEGARLVRFANSSGRAVDRPRGRDRRRRRSLGRPVRSRPDGALRSLGRLCRFCPGRQPGRHRCVEADLRCPVPVPRQVFAIGLNYRSHAEESGMATPEVPATFTKFPASLGGPSTMSRSSARASTGRSSWSPSSAPAPTASPNPKRGPRGRTHRGPGHQRPPPPVRRRAQFSLGKSRRGYGPMGPWVVTLDEFSDP
jgi:2-keto-4-pentenoate hydratase/2-oxohepta-3-ene-1,7-dioic acid hydratase in catechol pathway